MQRCAAALFVLLLALAACRPGPGPQEATRIPEATGERQPTMPTGQPTVPVNGSQLPAFPGAEGFGAQTPGGRGGRIIYVTTLNDSGAGSLREALAASGPRMILFRVAGTISLEDDITVTEPYVTIAGQSAPGEGIQIRGGMLRIRTHDVVIRYLKLRPGDEPTSSDLEDRDALSLSGTRGQEVYNIVIDHCSMVWGPDIGGLSILSNVHHVTVQYSIMGEGLYLSRHPEADVEQAGHSKGVNIVQLNPKRYGDGYPRFLTLHHNLFTTSDQRMPQIVSAEHVDMVNNVIYNWGNKGAHGNPRSLNLINNMFIRGPATEALLIWSPDGNRLESDLFQHAVYEEGNIAQGFPATRGDPDWVYASTRFEPYSIKIAQTPKEAYDRIVQDVGANRPLRDSVDQRIIQHLEQRVGGFLNGRDLAWPALAATSTLEDSDQNGMPEAWERQYFGTISRSSSAQSNADFDADGYTDVEEYLNQTDPMRP